MKLIKLIILLLFSHILLAQQSDASLTTQVDTDIRNKTSPSSITRINVADAFQSLIDSKVSIVAPRLTTTSTNGYVWTANGTSGLGQWAAASGVISGLTTNRIPYATSATTLGDDSGLTWDATNNAITIGSVRIHSNGGGQNTFIGEQAGNFTLTSFNNTIVGYQAGLSLSSGGGNTLIGMQAGRLTTGQGNLFIGHEAGENNTTGADNTVIGNHIDPQSTTGSNQLSIQNAIFGSGNSATGTTVSSGNIGLYATTWGTSAAKVISVGSGTAPTTSPADVVQLWVEDVGGAGQAELRVRDELTNVTTVSPHNFSLIGEPSEPGAWSFYGEYTNKETGEREAVNVDMLKLARLLEQITGEKLVYKTVLKK